MLTKAWLLRRVLLALAIIAAPIIRRLPPSARAWLLRKRIAVLAVTLAIYLHQHGASIVLDLQVACDRLSSSAQHPSLAVSEVPSFAHAFDDSPYRLLWSAAQGQLLVSTTTPSGGTRDIWKSRAASPFVAAAGATSRVAESHGNFLIRERIRWRCVAQRVSQIAPTADGGAIVLGSFDDAAEPCSSLRWNLTFSVQPTEGTPHLRFQLQLGGASAALASRVQLTHALSVGEDPQSADAPDTSVWGLGVQSR